MKFEDIAKTVKQAFRLQVEHKREIDWAKKAWNIMGKAGLTAFEDEVGRLKVILRFFALTAIYYDFFSIAYDESESGYELWPGDWIDDFNINPFWIGFLAAKEEKSDKLVNEDNEIIVTDALHFLIDRMRSEVYNALLKNLGDVSEVFLFLYRSIDSKEDRDSLLNDADAGKMEAFGWVSEGCYRYF